MIDIDFVRNKIFSHPFKDYPSGKLVACLGLLNKTRYFGHNSRKSHPSMIRRFRNGLEGSCHHAEVAALNKVPRQSRHLLVLYVMRFHKNGDLTMAQPCVMCREYLKQNNVDFKNIFYTDWDGTWKCLGDDTIFSEVKDREDPIYSSAA